MSAATCAVYSRRKSSSWGGQKLMKKVRTSLGVATLILSVMFVTLVAAPMMAQDWPMFGQDLTNSANASQTSLTTGNVGRLAPKWTFTTGGDVSARAAVVDGVVYFPDWQGNLYALNADTGRVIWSHQLSDYGVAAGTVSRTAPTVVDGVLYIGTQYVASGPTGWLMAINARTGHLIWKTQPDTSNGFPVITTSPVVVFGIVYVGMTSNEEFAAANPFYTCCSARGSVVAVIAYNWRQAVADLHCSDGLQRWGSLGQQPGCGLAARHGLSSVPATTTAIPLTPPIWPVSLPEA